MKADMVGALCTDNAVAIAGSGEGPLAGLTFVAKDVFDIAGVGTSFGHPEWLATHAAPSRTASAVQYLLDAGADMIGKAHSDELCYSLTGENVHYGTPLNTAAPGHIPGGSSNGSAAAVAAGLCDFALGTDCGGSVRIPASYCGLLGIRPTLNKVATDGVVEFAPSFDVAGWFARDGKIMRRVGDVLFSETGAPQRATRLVIAADAFACVDADVKDAIAAAVDAVSAHFDNVDEVIVAEEGLDVWFQAFRTIQAFEVWRSLGDWVKRVQPRLGSGVASRLEWAKDVTPLMYRDALAEQARIRLRLEDILPAGTLLCVPTSPRPAASRNLPMTTIEVEYRTQAMRILCIAGLAGLPQITLPLARTADNLPLGLSLVGQRDADRTLLALAETLCPDDVTSRSFTRPFPSE